MLNRRRARGLKYRTGGQARESNKPDLERTSKKLAGCGQLRASLRQMQRRWRYCRNSARSSGDISISLRRSASRSGGGVSCIRLRMA